MPSILQAEPLRGMPQPYHLSCVQGLGHFRNMKKMQFFPSTKGASHNLSWPMNTSVHAIHFLLIHHPNHSSYYAVARLVWSTFPSRISNSSFLGSLSASAKTLCSGLQGWEFEEMFLQLYHSLVNVICAIAGKRPRAFHCPFYCPDNTRAQGMLIQEEMH